MPKRTSPRTRRGGMVGVRPARSNAGGATRGAERAALVKSMNDARKATQSSTGNPMAGSVARKVQTGTSLARQAIRKAGRVR